MADGIETPENMLRCMSNNYSALAFWRAWHRSFNRWIIRYIYIPLGGSKRPIINTFAVFTFVAFWHDISLKLLAWGWLVTLFILPEVVARMIMPPKKVRLPPIELLFTVVGFMAMVPTCLRVGCCWKYIDDDDCKFDRILCGLGWNNGSVERDRRKLLR